jgi:hypothetical protein
MSFPLPEPVSFDMGMGIQTVTSLAEARAALARLPADVGEKPVFRLATALVARAIVASDDNAIADATSALKAAFDAEGMARHY